MESEHTKKRFIESSSFYTNCESENPFSKMKIDDCSFLNEVPHRSKCPKCHKSRKYYCYTCYVAVDEITNRLPKVHLPVQIDIIKHPKEVDGKSTSAHAAILAPESVKVHIYPHFPSYESKQVLLIFPCPSALTLEEWWNSETEKSPSGFKERKLPFTKVVFIDSTWRQTKVLYSDPRLQKLPCVVLSSHKSLFWRYYRGKKDTHLSTVEAVYHFCTELGRLTSSEPGASEGQYDNLLFFFRFMYFKIRTLYDPAKIKAYASQNGDS